MCFVFVLLFPHLYSCTTYRSTKNHCCNVLCQDKTRRSLCAEDPRGSQVLLRPRPRDDWGATNCTALNCPYCTALLTTFLHSCTALPIYTACTVVIGLPLLHCRFDTTALFLHHAYCTVGTIFLINWTALLLCAVLHHQHGITLLLVPNACLY